jgi:N-acetylglucosamine kinase-like BadF-type ATPase
MIKAEQNLPGTEGGRGERVGDEGSGGEMTRTMYAHVNK